VKTELQFSDMYCLMAAHVYIDLWKETGEFFLSLLPDLFSVSVTSSLNVLHSVVAGNDNYVWQSLGVLHEGLTLSPSNAQFKLLLLLVYCQLGAFEPVVDLYTSLDAKHVQHDTIGSVQIHNCICACIYQGGEG